MKYWFDNEFGCVVCEPNNATECFRTIIDIGFDYDGYTTVEGLQKLVDELLNYAKLGLKCIDEYKITDNDTAEEESITRTKAYSEADNWLHKQILLNKNII